MKISVENSYSLNKKQGETMDYIKFDEDGNELTGSGNIEKTLSIIDANYCGKPDSLWGGMNDRH